jgi:hypothetical protein
MRRKDSRIPGASIVRARGALRLEALRIDANP